MRSESLSTSLLLVPMLAIVMVVTPGPLRAADTRKPNRLEMAYTAMVQDGYGADLCRKISPRALNRLTFNSRGTRVYYQRSACFFYAAATELNAAYCDDVVEAKAWFLDGSFFSPESCRKYVAAGKPWRAATGIGNHEELLRAAGFTDEDLASAVPNAGPAGAWMEFYYQLRRSPDGRLQHRLDRLPDFSNE